VQATFLIVFAPFSCMKMISTIVQGAFLVVC